jgi:hypothetical protein
MAWYDLVENPKAISALYTTVPELDFVHIFEVNLNGYGWIDIKTDLPSFPDIIPQKWKWKGYNRVLLSLRFSSILSFQFERWGPSEPVHFQIDEKESGIISFAVYTQNCWFQGEANYAYLTLQKEIIK